MIRSDVSLGHTSNIRSRLNQGEFIETSNDGMRVSRPKELLREWGNNYSFRRNIIHRFWTPLKTLDLEKKIFSYARKENIKLALTAFSAGEVYAPAVIQPRLFAYWGGEISKIEKLPGIKRVESGENVQLIEPYDDGVFLYSREIKGRVIVSPVQAWLDLVALGGRGTEAAQAIMERVLLW